MSYSDGFIYVRVSTNRQAEKGYSLSAQIENCRSLAKKKNINIIQEFVEEGESGTNVIGRPQFVKMIDRCRDRENWSNCCVSHRSICKKCCGHINLKSQLKLYGVSIYSVMQPSLEDDSPTGILMDTILASINEFYSRDLGEKTKSGMKQKFREGIYPGMVPIGYKNTLGDIFFRFILINFF